MASYEIDSALMRLDEETENANAVKQCVLQKLLQNEVITEEEFKEYNTKWNVIIVKKSWFKRWMDKFSNNDDGYIFKYVNFED